MNKFLLSFQKSPIIAHSHLEQKNAVGPLVESHRWPNIGKLPIIQPKTTGGPTLAHRWQYLPTIWWATGGMLSGTALKVSQSVYCFTTSISHGVENYFPRLWGTGISDAIFRDIMSIFLNTESIDINNVIQLQWPMTSQW